MAAPSAGAIGRAFWRALRRLATRRILLLSLLPVGLALLLWLLLFWLLIVGGTAAMPSHGSSPWLDGLPAIQVAYGWLDQWGLVLPVGALAVGLAGILAIAVSGLLVFLLFTAFMVPVLAKKVAGDEFPGLAVSGRERWLYSLWWSLRALMLALLALVLSLPLWLVPLLGLVIPPLIWGWLSYRVMAFDALSVHATDAERLSLLRNRFSPLLLIGIGCGFISALPLVSGAFGALVLLHLAGVALLLAVPLVLWLYVMLFLVSALWFVYYCLQALSEMRQRESDPLAPPLELS